MLGAGILKRAKPYEDQVMRVLTTSCFECFTLISGWKATKHDHWSFMSIGSLSNHHAVWRDSWRGRLRIAYAALRGRTLPDIELFSREDAEDFIRNVSEVVDEVWPVAR